MSRVFIFDCRVGNALSHLDNLVIRYDEPFDYDSDPSLSFDND